MSFHPGQDMHQKIHDSKTESSFSISYKDSSEPLNPAYQVRDQYGVLLCLSDHMICDTGAKKAEISSDTLLLFSSMDLHRFGPEKPGGQNRSYILYFDPDCLSCLSGSGISLLDCFLYRPFEDACCMKLAGEQAEKLQGMMDRILSLKVSPEGESYGRELRIQLALAELLLEINVYYRKYHHIKDTDNCGNFRLIYEIIEYINSSYSEEIQLDLLARNFHINKYSLCQDFKKVTGITPNQYVISYRLERAKEMLIRGDSVEKVCMQTGFNNLSHFSRTFKSRVGMSPKKFQIINR